MPKHASEAWKRLGNLLVARRIDLNVTYRNRRAFAADTNLDYRVLYDIERARRDNYTDSTLAAIEKAYKWAPGSIQRVLGGDLPVEVAEVSASTRLPLSVHASTSRPPSEAPEGSREWLMAAVREFCKRLSPSDARAILEEYAPVPEVPEGSADFVDLASPVERQIWRIEELPAMWREQLIGVLRHMREVEDEGQQDPPNDSPGEVTELRQRR